jgi:DNA processing protein
VSDVRVLERSRFPPLLRAIFDPPKRLYVRGGAGDEVLERRTVAIVGARACSPYGAQVARRLGRELARAGLVVVSGLARGIDGEAHRGALEAGGVTVGVLGCGIDRDYPAAHAELARRIRETGLVVSEYEPGVEPAPWRFPASCRTLARQALADAFGTLQRGEVAPTRKGEDERVRRNNRAGRRRSATPKSHSKRNADVGDHC